MDNSTQKNNDLLMRYVDDELDAAERAAFEEKLAGDKDLQAEFEQLQLAKMAIKSYGLKNEIGSLHQGMMNELRRETPVKRMTPVQKVIRYSIAAAASVALVFIAFEGYKFYMLSPQRLYAENHIPYELPVLRDTGTTDNAIEKAYRVKNYSEITKTVYPRSFSPKESLLRGLAYLETGDFSRAITSFHAILADSSKKDVGLVKDQAEYYLALAYLKNRDYDQAIEIMSLIHDNPQHTYHERFSLKYIRRVKMLKWR